MCFTVTGSSQEPNPIAEAIRWVGVVTTIGAEMVLPGVLGLWLDRRWGLSFLGLGGFVLGFAVGIWSLVQLTRQPESDSQDRDDH